MSNEVLNNEITLGEVAAAPADLPAPTRPVKENAISTILRILDSFFKYLEGLPDKLTREPVQLQSGQQYLLELGFITIVLFSIIVPVRDFADDIRLPGDELSYLINGVVMAEYIHNETGAIPLWNPFMGYGEPTMESPHSFLLNPFMTLPTMVWGVFQGPKVSVIIHVILIGVGGWMLGYALRLGVIGRITLALLFGATGGIPWALSRGFFQIALSQAYTPWVYAGLIGMIHFRTRRWIGMFAIASMLMVFAGSFWYVLPTAISGGLLLIFALFFKQSTNSGFKFDRSLLNLCLWAILLMVGLSAIRLIPQAAHADYVYHPTEQLTADPLDFLEIVATYFKQEPFNDVEQGLHYIMPPVFGIVLFAVATLVPVYKETEQRRWWVIIPAFLLIFLFTVWAQEGTPFLHWLYSNFPLLRQWRFLRRMLAAATPWIAVLIAIGLEDSLLGLLDYEFQRRLVKYGLMLVLAALAVTTVVSALGNWVQLIRMEHYTSDNAPAVYALRKESPHDFIQIETLGFFDYFPFHLARVRATFGNPDYKALPLEPTIGTIDAMKTAATYGTVNEDSTRTFYIDNNMMQLESDVFKQGNELWYNPNALDYAFLIDPRLLEGRTTPIERSMSRQVPNFIHNLDEIIVNIDKYSPDDVLVIQETAYPGWEVQINGEQAVLESVGGFLGIRLPEPTGDRQSLQIVFYYHPRLLYAGALVTMFTILVTVIYLLKLEGLLLAGVKRLLPAARSAPVPLSDSSSRRARIADALVEDFPDIVS